MGCWLTAPNRFLNNVDIFWMAFCSINLKAVSQQTQSINHLCIWNYIEIPQRPHDQKMLLLKINPPTICPSYDILTPQHFVTFWTKLLTAELFLDDSWSVDWRHNERNGVSNHQPNDCLLNRLFRRRSKKTPKLRVTGFCAGNSPVMGEFPAQRSSNTENVSFDDTIMWKWLGSIKTRTGLLLWKMDRNKTTFKRGTCTIPLIINLFPNR